MNYHRFFEENFPKVKDMDVRNLEENVLKYPRDEIIAAVIVYVSLCKMLGAENMRGSMEGQSKFLEQLKRKDKGGLSFDQLRNVFPQLRYESQFLVSTILNSSIASTSPETTMTMEQFLKCTRTLKCGTYEEKVRVLCEVIDHDAKGYLTWKDMKMLCKQSLTLCVDAKTSGLLGAPQQKSLFTAEERRYVKGSESKPDDDFEEEISTYFADMIFERIIGRKEDRHKKHQHFLASQFSSLSKINKYNNNNVSKERQQISIEEIR